MVNKKSLATFVRTLGNQVIAGFKHFLNNVKIGGDLIHDPDPLGSAATNVLTVDAQGVVRKATSVTGGLGGGTVTSVALTAPSAFTVTGSPITTSGTIAIGGAGTASQYVRGDGQLADFPTSGGGGSSVSYYLNGSVNQGTFGGNVYREFNKTPIVGAGTDFTIAADGYIAQFITDANDPSLLEIPGGNWNIEFWFSASSSGGTPSFYVELSKYDGTTFTAIASNSAFPEFIAFGTTISQYYTALAVPQTTLAITDRLALRIYVIHSGRTITLHTEDNHLCQVITTFSTGLNALNGLTKQVQYFATGTSGADFNISSVTDTHTFNIPTASSLNRGALSSADWTNFTAAYNDKINSAAVTGTTTKTLTLTQQDGGTITASWTDYDTAPVTSVFGRTGAVIAVGGDYNTSQVTESGNLYFTDSRARLAISAGAGISYNNTTGVVSSTITQYTDALARASISAGTGISYNSTTGVITNSLPDQTVSITAGSGISVSGSYPSFTVASTITQYTDALARAAISLTTTGTSGAATYNNTTGVLNVPQYQSVLTNPVTGTGTTNYVSKFTGTSTVGNSQIFDNGTNVGIGTATPSAKLTTITNATGWAGWIENQDTTGNGSGLVITGASNVGGISLLIRKQDGTSTMTVLGDGNVGIGTTSPLSKLHVETSASNPFRMVRTGGSATNFGYEFGSGAIGLYDYTNLTYRYYITSGGNVGIGTTAPNGKLQVDGDFYVNGLDRKIMNYNGAVDYGTLTNNSVRFNQNGAEIARISTAGNFGIGTTTPGSKLEVNGNIKLSSTAGSTATPSNIWLGNDYSNGATRDKLKIYLFNSGTEQYGFSVGASGDVQYHSNVFHDFYVNNGNVMRINSSGNVGIGTTTPGAKLDVIGNARATTLSTTSGLGLNVGAYAYLSQTISGVMTFLGHNVRASDSVANTAVVQNGSWISSLIKLYYSDGITFHTDSTVYAAGATYPLSTTERMRIQTNGNVGIGTSSAFSRFTVSGALTASSSQMSIVNTEGGHSIIRAGIAGINNNGMSFVTANVDGSSQNVRMVINASGLVGIGTLSPSASLHVASSFGVIFGATAGGVGTSQITTASAGSPVSSRFAFGTDGSGWQYRIAKNTAGTIVDLVTVADSGNVGIGTTSPAYPLDIVGFANSSSGFRATNGTVDNRISWSSGNVGFLGTISNHPIALNTNATERVRITAAGDVGIGTTSPGASLHVAGTIGSTPTGDGFLAGIQSGYAVIHLNGSAATGSYIDFSVSGTDTKGRILYDNTNNYFGFNTNGSERLRITSTGNLGIGTTSPGASIHVAGAINSIPTGDGFLAGIQGGYAVIHLNGSAATGSFIDFSVSGTDTKGRILYDNTNNYFGFNTNGAERLKITSTGDVGIGTSSPSAKLHVIGNATVSATLSTANAKISGTLADYLNQVGTAGQVLSSTGTGIEWITGGGGGGGSTIAVKDEGTSIGSSFGTLDFYGENVQATASGSTAIIAIRNNAGTGSQYLNDLVNTYAIPGSYTDTVNINGVDIIVPAPGESKSSETLTAILTFGILNVTGSDRFNAFYFRLYNNTTAAEISDTQHRWSSYMSVDDPTTIATFHIPIKLNEISFGDDIYVQCQTSVVDAPEIYYCALTFIKGSN